MTETNCGAGASWCQSVWTSEPPLVDPVIIDGMAIGFLCWVVLILFLMFHPRVEDITPRFQVTLGLMCVGSGIAIGWLWS
jgi:hypothetical protein